MPTIIRAGADYEAEDTLILREPALIRVLVDDARVAICSLLRDRSYSIQQLSKEMGVPKGTVGHHVKVLEEAGLIRVVRTRQVRAITEKFYGRTAWMFIVEAEGVEEDRGFAAAGLRRAATEIEQAPEPMAFGVIRARLAPADRRRFDRRLRRLLDDFAAAEQADGEPCVLAAGMYRRDVGT